MTARAQEWARDEHQPECNGFPWQQNLPPFLPIISRSRLSAYYTLFGKFADTSELVVRDRYQHWWLRRGQKMSEMKFYIFWSN